MNESAAQADICTIWVKQGDEWAAACVIDGRRYPDPGAVKRLSLEALDELENRDIPAELETQPINLTQPPSKLPTWEEYQKTLPPIGEGRE